MSFHSLVTLVIGVFAALASRSVPLVHLAHMRVTSLLPLIHLFFGPVEAAKTWKEEGTRLFSVEEETDRLAIGPIDTRDGGSIFGIARGKGRGGLSSAGKRGWDQEQDSSGLQDKPLSEIVVRVALTSLYHI